MEEYTFNCKWEKSTCKKISWESWKNQDSLKKRDAGPDTVGAMEKAIAEVWKECLPGLKTLVPRNDDFFEKGGDSLKAMAVVNELNNKQLSDTKISLVLLFSNSTPKMLAAALEKSKIQSENTDMEEGTI
ncbi:MAG: phosphopantetheine-binding protein [Sellimonas intestinalis]